MRGNGPRCVLDAEEFKSVSQRGMLAFANLFYIHEKPSVLAGEVYLSFSYSMGSPPPYETEAFHCHLTPKRHASTHG